MILSGRTELTAFDKTLTLNEWARETGLAIRTLKSRLERRAKSGPLTQEAIEEALQKQVEDKSAGARTRNLQRLMMAVEANVSQELLDKEVGEFIKNRGALAFFKEFRDFFPKGASVALDGGNERTTQQPARITIFNSPAPEGPTGLVINAD